MKDDEPKEEEMHGDMKDDAMADDMEMDLDVEDEKAEMIWTPVIWANSLH